MGSEDHRSAHLRSVDDIDLLPKRLCAPEAAGIRRSTTEHVELTFIDNFDLLTLGLCLLHTAGVRHQTFHAVFVSRRFSHFDLLPFLLCAPEAFPVRRNTLDRLFSLLDGLVDGLFEVLVHALLRFAFGALGSSIHEAIEIPLSLDLHTTC